MGSIGEAGIAKRKCLPDAHFRKSMSPAAEEACRIVSRIRTREIQQIWTKDLEEDLAQHGGEIVYPGMMFNLAKEKMVMQSSLLSASPTHAWHPYDQLRLAGSILT